MIPSECQQKPPNYPPAYQVGRGQITQNRSRPELVVTFSCFVLRRAQRYQILEDGNLLEFPQS